MTPALSAPGRREVGKALVLSVVLATIPLLVSAATGSLGVARNDDWVYSRTLFRFVDTGVFQPEFASATTIGWILLSWPIAKVFGHSLVALQIWGGLWAAAGLWGTWALVRSFLSRRLAWIPVVMLGTGPLFPTLTSTFMTDIPSYAVGVLSMVALVRWLAASPRNLTWYYLAVVGGVVGFSIREFAAPVLVVTAVTGFVAGRRAGMPALARILAVNAVAATACLAVLRWRRSIPGSFAMERGQALEPQAVSRFVDNPVLTVGLLTIPVILFISLRAVLAPARAPAPAPAPTERDAGTRSIAPSRVVFVLVVALATVLWAKWATSGERTLAFMGNYINQSVPYPSVIGGAPPKWTTPWVWATLIGLSIATVGVVAGVYVASMARSRRQRGTRGEGESSGLPHWRAARRVAEVSALGCALGVIGLQFYTGKAGLDRYLMPAAPLLAAAVLSRAAEMGWVRSAPTPLRWSAVAGSAVLGLHLTTLSAAFDGMKWRFSEDLTVSQDVRPEWLDGGYEWFGSHQPGIWDPAPTLTSDPFWTDLFRQGRVCLSVRYASPSLPAASIVERRTVRSLFGTEVELVATTAHQLRCPPAR